MTVPIPYYEEPQSELYISPRGAVSFGKALPEKVEDLESVHEKVIAVLYAGAVNGLVYYRTEPHDSELSRSLATTIQRVYSDAKEFQPRVVVIVTWDRIISSESTGENSFQLILLSDARTSYVFKKFGRIEWVKANGIFAQSGFYFSDGRSQKNVNAGTDNVKELTTMSNYKEEGSFLFRVSGSHPQDPREGPANDDYDYVKDEADYDASDAELQACPSDPYKDKCPPTCQVVSDDKGCSLCICADRPEPNRPATNDIGDEVYLPPNEPIDEGFSPDEQQPHQPLPPLEYQPQHPVPAGEYQPQHPMPIGGESDYLPQQPLPELQPDVGQQQVHLPRDDPAYAQPDGPVEQPLKDGTCADVQAHPVPSCHQFASCQDHTSGFCCQCSGDYIGNGIDCVKPTDPQRINGFFEGAINGQAIPKNELFIFVQPKDGQQHTALPKIPQNLATSLLLLDPIANVMGWLGARRDSENAYNGFELTGGVFNRTVNIHLGDRYAILIKQEFTGRRTPKEALNVNVFVSGTLPNLAQGSEVNYDNFVDTYKRERPGFLRAYTEREATIRENGEERKVRMTVDQQIHYTECKHADFDKSDTIKIRVSRINAHISPSDNAVRFAASNSAVDPSKL